MALPFLLAAATGNITAVESAITSNPALLTSTNPDGRNALHLAAFHSHLDTLRLLLSYSEPLSSQKDSLGQTPLHIAAQGPSPDIVDLLLQNDDGTSCSARDREGKTPIFYAYQNPCLEVLARFLGSVNSCGSGCALTPEIVLRSGASDYFGSASTASVSSCGPSTTATKCCVKTQS